MMVFVRFTDKGGRAYERELAERVLKVGKVYEVKRYEQGRYQSRFWLQKFPDPFNSVMFEVVPMTTEQAINFDSDA